MIEIVQLKKSILHPPQADSAICHEFRVEDRSHITCIRFSQKRDILYTSHSIGYITMWKCQVDGSKEERYRYEGRGVCYNYLKMKARECIIAAGLF
jgi:hypothetical protein